MVRNERVIHAFRYFDRITEVTLLAIHLDVIVQELLEISSIKDTVRGWS